jgi:adenylosuccinate lyase
MWERYALPRMRGLWTLDAQYERWLRVELVALEALEELGLVPAGVSARVKARARVDREAFLAREREIGHDLLAFLEVVEEQVGEEGRWLHYGLTSSDVKDTALALAIRDALELVLERARGLARALWVLALSQRNTPMIGRTHGQYAEVTTFGLKVAVWYEELRRVEERLRRARQTIAVGKLAGAVGTHAYFPPEAEVRALARLELTPCPVTSQVISRDRHAEVLYSLAAAASAVEKIALEVRHLSRSEVGEVAEGRPEGSSAMPHKRNPILSERLCGLARLIRASLGPALEDNALWHERDMSHSSVERVLLPQCFILTDYMLTKARELLENLRVFPERMLARLLAARGLPFSEGLLLALVGKGMSRRQAHALVAQLSTLAEEGDRELSEVAAEHPRVKELLSQTEIEAIFDLGTWLRGVWEAFRRVSPPG